MNLVSCDGMNESTSEISELRDSWKYTDHYYDINNELAPTASCSDKDLCSQR